MEKMSLSSQGRKSNAQKKREAAERVRLLIEKCEARGVTLPTKNGTLLHRAIKEQANLGNGQIDGNDDIKNMLEAHAARNGLKYSSKGSVAPEEDTPPPLSIGHLMVPADRLRTAQMRLAVADRKNAELAAENASLRSQLRMSGGGEVAELIALGGRITSEELDL